MKVLLPDSMILDPHLPGGVEAVVYAASSAIPDKHLDAEVLVTWAATEEWLAEHARKLTHLRLVQGLAAGPDSLLRAGFDSDVVLCTGVGLHSRMVAEHALALVLALVRELPKTTAAQQEHRWASELGGPRPLHPDGPVTTLLDANVLVWGFGSIAQTLAPHLTSLGAEVRGVAHQAGRRGGYEVIAVDDVDAALPEPDILIQILPSNEETRGIVGAKRLALLGPDGYIVNVGRGVTIDNDALVDALQSGMIAGAALDVTETEPLPKDSLLWDAQNVIITPHSAGGRPLGADELIVKNVTALASGGNFENKL